MKRKFINIIAIAVLVSGVLILLYPFISQWLYERSVAELVSDFEAEIDELDKPDELDALYELLQAENELLYAEGQKNLKDPFSYETPGISLSEYGLSDNCIGYVVIPRIDQTLPIYLGASEANMKKGAVHLTQTSYPIGGNHTNSVLAAHRGYSGAAMFRNIDKIQINDDIYIRNFKETLRYRVTATKIISPDQIDQVLIQEGKDMITLLSCHPYRQNRQRYLVYCERYE